MEITLTTLVGHNLVHKIKHGLSFPSKGHTNASALNC